MLLLIAVVLSASLVPEPAVVERPNLTAARVVAGAAYVASAGVFVWAIAESLREGGRLHRAPLEGVAPFRIPPAAIYASGAVLAAVAIGLSIWTLFWSQEPG